MSERLKAATLSLRLTPELLARTRRAMAAHPFNPTLTAVVERGLELAILELTAQCVPKGPAHE